MAYSTKRLFETAMEKIAKHKLLFIEDIVSLLPCHKSTFYEHFPTESDEYKAMHDELEKNRTEIKISLRKKWFDSDNATTQIALYKLISTQKELKSLTNQTISGDADNPINLKEINIKIV
jgi:hypothetical protein